MVRPGQFNADGTTQTPAQGPAAVREKSFRVSQHPKTFENALVRGDGFFNDGPGRVRWLETQMPQPPRRNSYRWYDDWKQLET